MTAVWLINSSKAARSIFELKCLTSLSEYICWFRRGVYFCGYCTRSSDRHLMHFSNTHFRAQKRREKPAVVAAFSKSGVVVGNLSAHTNMPVLSKLTPFMSPLRAGSSLAHVRRCTRFRPTPSLIFYRFSFRGNASLVIFKPPYVPTSTIDALRKKAR